MLGASAVPLAITGAVSTGLSERALRERIHQDFVTLAASAADDVRRGFHDLGRALAVYPELVPLERSPPDLATGVLRVAYRAHEDLLAVAFLDDHGAPLVGAVSLSDPEAAARLGRVAVTDDERHAFLDRVPHQEALRRGFAVSAPALSGTPRCAIAVAVGHAGARRVVAADVSLARAGARLAALSVGGTDVLLVDDAGVLVAGGSGARAPGARLVLPARGAVAGTPLVAAVDDGGHPALAAFASVGDLGLGVLVIQPEAQAMASVDDLRRRLLYWLGVAALCALVVGIGLARDVGRRARALSAGTAALGAGRFVRLDEAGGDELADLARSFNHMAGELGRARTELLAWSEELERRVAEKTAELRQAEELLLRARSLAAVGTLGAGVAHEINNPLCGLLGSAQLLLMDAREGERAYPLLREIESQAQRIRAITGNLLRIARAERGDDLETVDLNGVVDSVLGAAPMDELARDKITVERKLVALPALRANRQLLEEALLELVTNARRAMPGGGVLTVATSSPDPRVVSLRVSDTGRGMERDALEHIFDPFYTTKTSWRATGFGLTLVHKIVAEHGGTIAVESEPGRGSTFTLTFPAGAGARPHLA